MTGTTVNSAAIDINQTVNTTANNRKTAAKTQDFGEVLNNTAKKSEQPKKSYDETSKKTEQPKKADASAGTDKSEKTTEMSKNDKKVEEKTDTDIITDKKLSDADEDTVDEMTVNEIADILQQIIEQIKEILGVTDEELLSGMKEAGLESFDLLDPANMIQLVTAVSGENSAINLVTDEELYTAMQDITKMVDAQVNTLMEDTQLTHEELDIVLQKLQEMDKNPLTVSENIVANAEQEAGLETDGVGVIVQNITDEDEKASVKSDVMTELPENQQENMSQVDTNLRTQSDSGRQSEDNQSKDFGQNQNMTQDFQNNMSEAVNAASEDVQSFTSQNTESILRQLADMVRIVKGENLTEMEMQLHPASLGTVNVSLTTKGGVVTAEFTTQNEAVKAAIEAQASQLRANLEEQGVKIEAIEVSVESHQMERNLDKNNHEQNNQSQDNESRNIQGVRRKSINLNAFESDDELADEMQGADDAERIAMEMMSANGNSMDIMA